MKKGQMIESSEARKMIRGSYEERIEAISEALQESEFSGSILATHPSKILVLSEAGEFWEIQYSLDENNAVTFSEPSQMKVKTFDESTITSGIVDGFMRGNDILESMHSKVMSAIHRPESVFNKLVKRAEFLEAKSIWKSVLDKHRELVTEAAFTLDSGHFNFTEWPSFETFYMNEHTGEISEDDHSAMLESVVALERSVARITEIARKHYGEYEQIADGERDQEADQVLGQFESFAEDFIGYMDKVGGFISESVGRYSKNNAACLAYVHDTVAKQTAEFELGARLIRKVSVEFSH